MEYRKLCDVCDFQGGSQPPKDEWSFDLKDGYIRMLQIRDFTQSERVTPEYIKITKTTKTCEADDILIARYGASLGKILTGLAGAYNVAIMRTIPNTEVLSKKYLYYYLKSPVFQGFLLQVGSRAAQAGFNKNDLQDLMIPEITLEQQNEIVGVLERVEKIIEARQQELQKLDELIKARFVEMFSTEEHKEKLVNLCKFINGDRGKNYPSGTDIVNYGVPFINAGHLEGNRIDFSDMNYITEEKFEALNSGKIQENDVLYCLRGSLGKKALVEIGKGAIASSLLILRSMGEIEPIFLLYSLEQPYILEQMKKANNGSSQPNLSAQSVKDYEMILPCREKQIAFVEFVKQVDKSKFAVQKALDEAQLLFDSLMQKYFG